jgi:hypothetical protein
VHVDDEPEVNVVAVQAKLLSSIGAVKVMAIVAELLL